MFVNCDARADVPLVILVNVNDVRCDDNGSCVLNVFNVLWCF